MKHRPADKPRLWPLRLVQFAPVVALGLLVGAWFAVPTSIRDLALGSSSAEYSANEASAWRDSEFGILRQLLCSQRIPGKAYSTPADSQNPAGQEFSAACATTTNPVMKNAWRLHDASGMLTSFPLPKDDPAFSALAEYEKRSGARVFAFAIPARPDPPIALSAVTYLGALTKAERKEYKASGTIRSVRDEFARENGWRNASVLPIDIDESSSSSSWDEDAARGLEHKGMLVGGHAYEVYSLLTATTGNWPPFPALRNRTTLDSRENRQAIRRAASAGRGAVFVVGPTDAAPVPLLAPDRSTSRTQAALKAANNYLPYNPSDLRLSDARVRRLDPTLAEQLGGGKWVTSVVGLPSGLIARSPDGRSAPRDPMLYVAVWDANPNVAIMWEAVGRTRVREFQVWLGLRLPFVLGVLGVLLAASLIASPLAFVRERHLTAELEIEREQERIRRAARENVIGRLTDLSSRIDRAAGDVAGDNRSDVARAARDIDATIIDLRRILGELDVRGDGHE